ncbi:BnaC01g38110D [Brassica napus]|uniref:BnaC01g38110D protein n=1 Tax=Brassica napus TaxID=3708 RepID=A0A078GFT6_BRANA|nr:BnaC01g38110D [Brassica napus]
MYTKTQIITQEERHGQEPQGVCGGNLSTQTSAWMELQTEETSASTQNQRLTQRRKEESRGVDKKGKNHQ